MMTAYASIDSAVKSIKEGLYDYIQKPFEPEILIMTIERAMREKRMALEIKNLRKEINKRYSFSNIIGKHPKMQNIFDLIQKVATHDAKVLIFGETGVGKELVAKAIHYNSRRKSFPFVCINCAGLSETLLESELFGYEKGAFTGAYQTRKGKFEYAQGGTIFLDEVGDISPKIQVKLLRVLQERKFERVGGNETIDSDVRILAATDQELKEKIKRNEFRIELFYRLNVFPIRIPPLRERIEDIPLLLKHFIKLFNKKYNKNIETVSPIVLKKMMEYYWPGNVRELENVLERAFVTADEGIIDEVTLTSGDVVINEENGSFFRIDIGVPFKLAKSMVIQKFEREYFLKALEENMGNVSEAARKAGLNPRTFWRKIKSYQYNRTEFIQKNGM
jgi:DNA-binding NtrC family response regulator